MNARYLLTNGVEVHSMLITGGLNGCTNKISVYFRMSEMKKLILASMLIIISFNAVANIEVSKSAAKLIKAQPELLTKIVKKQFQLARGMTPTVLILRQHSLLRLHNQVSVVLVRWWHCFLKLDR